MSMSLPLFLIYTVDYEEDGIPLGNTLDVTPIPIINSNNLADYHYLLHTTHKDDEDNKSYIWILLILTPSRKLIHYLLTQNRQQEIT